MFSSQITLTWSGTLSLFLPLTDCHYGINLAELATFTKSNSGLPRPFGEIFYLPNWLIWDLSLPTISISRFYHLNLLFSCLEPFDLSHQHLYGLYHLCMPVILFPTHFSPLRYRLPLSHSPLLYLIGEGRTISYPNSMRWPSPGHWTDEIDNSLLVTKTQPGEEDTACLHEESEGS